jgi:uncharacterized membrane protein YeaQ/YmgE (transglycosylase-associated protein family)
MTITLTSIIMAIVVGAIVGVLARLALPGRQNISAVLTVVVGIVGAFLGTIVARALHIPTVTNGIDWLELLVQVAVAALGIALISGASGRRSGVVGSRRRSGLFSR